MLVKAIINSIPRIAQEAGCRCVLPSQRQSGGGRVRWRRERQAEFQVELQVELMLVKAIINSIPRIAQEAGCRCVLPSQRQPGLHHYAKYLPHSGCHYSHVSIRPGAP
ncbi:uncharacterized protein LOC143701878 [Siphateles boraxobius]|uniref:uncharacterized protein LOC143701878 n=1 Tax=Siphateles boraxobius TaxID=180520 RepID=UPI0040642EFB